jgi:ABC-type multidrug transport system fused ATPase/permease subunit
LFSALRFPINFAGRLLGKATQAYSALQRIALFLDRDLRESDEFEKASMTEGTSSPESSLSLVDVVAPLTLSRASFYIGSEPSPESSEACDDHGTFFRVSKFDLSLQKGEVLAVCGPVGSGKVSPATSAHSRL